MTTRSISTTYDQDVCDVCGRTLLRGESTEVFLSGGRRMAVCELCKQHAIHEGWVREGTIPDYQETGSSQSRRGSLFGRLRGRGTADGEEPSKKRRGGRSLDDELGGDEWQRWQEPAEPAEPEPQAAPELQFAPPPRVSRREARRQAGAQRQAPPADDLTGPYEQVREPRHVHAIPSDGSHKAAAAVNAFNGSEFCRTIAGVARSLGAPTVNVNPDAERPGSVWIVASWELCWYRYEVDISDGRPSVRLDAQGYELAELPESQQLANAAANDVGQVTLA